MQRYEISRDYCEIRKNIFTCIIWIKKICNILQNFRTKFKEDDLNLGSKKCRWTRAQNRKLTSIIGTFLTRGRERWCPMIPDFLLQNICTTMRMAKPFSIFMRAAADSLFYYIARLLPIVHRPGEFISQTQRKSDPSKLSARGSRFALFSDRWS